MFYKKKLYDVYFLMPRYHRKMLANIWVYDAQNIISIFHQHNSWWVSHATISTQSVPRISSDCIGEISHNFLLLQIYPYEIIMECLEDIYLLARNYHCQIMFSLLDAIEMFADAYITLSSGHLVYGTWVWWIVCLFISHHLAFLGRQQGQWWLPI